jgi:hypothetical protein
LKGNWNVKGCGRGNDNDTGAAFPRCFEIFHGANSERRANFRATISARIKRQDVVHAQSTQVLDMALADGSTTDN